MAPSWTDHQPGSPSQPVRSLPLKIGVKPFSTFAVDLGSSEHHNRKRAKGRNAHQQGNHPNGRRNTSHRTTSQAVLGLNSTPQDSPHHTRSIIAGQRPPKRMSKAAGHSPAAARETISRKKRYFSGGSTKLRSAMLPSRANMFESAGLGNELHRAVGHAEVRSAGMVAAGKPKKPLFMSVPSAGDGGQGLHVAQCGGTLRRW